MNRNGFSSIEREKDRSKSIKKEDVDGVLFSRIDIQQVTMIQGRMENVCKSTISHHTDRLLEINNSMR